MNTKVSALSLSKSAFGLDLLCWLMALSLVLAMLAMAVNPARAQADTEGGGGGGTEAGGGTDGTATDGAATEGTEPVALCAVYHTVVRGETLYKIGLKYGISWTLIAEANKLANPNRIYTGQVLCIPGDEAAEGTMYVQVKKIDVNIRKGPGMSYKVIGILRSWKTALITGKSADGDWWRIVCLDGTTGECYVTANPTYVNVIVTGDSEPDEDVKIPTFSIKAVVEDKSVSITTANFPRNTNFVVRMGAYGTKGIGGEYVTTVNSGEDGSMTFKFAIPASLTDRARIAIRLESANGYYAYNWFYNATYK